MLGRDDVKRQKSELDRIEAARKKLMKSKRTPTPHHTSCVIEICKQHVWHCTAYSANKGERKKNRK